MVVYTVLILLGLIWTGIWIWILRTSRQEIPYAEVGPKVTLLRRRLFYVFVTILVIVLLVSVRLLPYPPVRAMSLGKPHVSIDVTALQWAWIFSQHEVPAGIPVEFAVTSQDVNHSFALYSTDGRLLTQVQAMPGYTNRLIYVFDQPGIYIVRCLEYCGLPHHAMVATVTAK